MLLIAIHNGQQFNPNTVMKALRHTWKIHKNLKIIPKMTNQYACTFGKLQDKVRVYDEQPWQVLGHLVFMNEYEVVFSTIPMWIRCEGLELEHYRPETI